jgi:hypothetical protein
MVELSPNGPLVQLPSAKIGGYSHFIAAFPFAYLEYFAVNPSEPSIPFPNFYFCIFSISAFAFIFRPQ